MKAKSILETLGRTPVVEISGKLNASAAKVFAKVEAFNPGRSAKDRVAVSMIEAAEREGRLKPGATELEKRTGLILDLFEPGFSPAFYPQFVDNTAFPSDWFEWTSACSRECAECGFCKKTWGLVAKTIGASF